MSVSIGSRCHVGWLLLLLLLRNHAKASNLELTCDIDLSDILYVRTSGLPFTNVGF